VGTRPASGDIVINDRVEWGNALQNPSLRNNNDSDVHPAESRQQEGTLGVERGIDIRKERVANPLFIAIFELTRRTIRGRTYSKGKPSPNHQPT
jgi:hypothetical protein